MTEDTCEHCNHRFSSPDALKRHLGLSPNSRKKLSVACPVLDPTKRRQHLENFRIYIQN